MRLVDPTCRHLVVTCSSPRVAICVECNEPIEWGIVRKLYFKADGRVRLTQIAAVEEPASAN